MRVVVKYFISVYIDNVGALFLSKNKLMSQQIKYIDTRHYLI